MDRAGRGAFASRTWVKWVAPRRLWAFGWVRSGLLATLGLAVGALAWELGGRLLEMPFFPPLSSVIARSVELIVDGTIPTYLPQTLQNLAIGAGITFAVGIVVGFLMGRYWRIDAALDVYVIALLTAPTLVFAPVFYAIFGLGSATPIGVVIVSAIPIVILNTRAGVREADRELLEMATSFGATERDRMRQVRLPAALPYVFAGITLATPAAIKGAINGEMFVAIIGLGGVIIQAGRSFDATTVLAILLVFIVLALGLVAVISAIERRLTSWQAPIHRQ